MSADDVVKRATAPMLEVCAAPWAADRDRAERAVDWVAVRGARGKVR
jgi:hypothetical protein